MTLPIYIPSMGRARALFGSISTLTYVKEVENPISIVVPPAEATAYREALFSQGRQDVVVLECPEKGIAKVRYWIGKTAARLKQPKFAMFDDDLNFAVRKSPATYNLRPQSQVDTIEMLGWVDQALDEYAHVGIAPRDASKSIGAGPPPLTMTNKRTLRTLCYQTEAFLGVEHGRVEVMEDFDVNLQLLRKGLPNIQTYWWTNDQRQTGSPGGCASYRSKEVHEASAVRLAELHAPFVKLRDKVNKGQVVKEAREMQTRKEVTIAWVKAYESSQESAK